MNEEGKAGLPPGGDGPPVDFAEYFGERLRLPATDVLSVLGRCLLDYEPLAPAPEQRSESPKR